MRHIINKLCLYIGIPLVLVRETCIMYILTCSYHQEYYIPVIMFIFYVVLIS